MKRKSIAFAFVGLGALLAVAAIAGPPVLPNLNPPAPDYYRCNATGSGAICRGQLVETVNQEPTGIICGTADNPVELLQSVTVTVNLTRYYDTAGNLTRRFGKEHWQGTVINPATGLSATFTATNNVTDTLAVPGDFGTTTQQQSGAFRISLPGSGGLLIIDAGRLLFDAEGNILSHHGHLQLFDYFGNGNHEEAAKLCAALGSPGTP